MTRRPPYVSYGNSPPDTPAPVHPIGEKPHFDPTCAIPQHPLLRLGVHVYHFTDHLSVARDERFDNDETGLTARCSVGVGTLEDRFVVYVGQHGESGVDGGSRPVRQRFSSAETGVSLYDARGLGYDEGTACFAHCF